MKLFPSLLALSWLVLKAHAFSPAFLSPTSSRRARASWKSQVISRPAVVSGTRHRLVALQTTSNDDNDEEEEENPYADPNYPDLEFVNYADPEYKVDQGVTDEFFDGSSPAAVDDTTEQEIEAMREDRRRRNDEFQFQTYFTSILKEGEEYKGEWTHYKTSTFLPELMADDDRNEEAASIPRLVKAAIPIQVVSSAYKTKVPTDSQFAVDAERIRHEEMHHSTQQEQLDEDVSPEARQVQEELLKNTYWPEQLAARDFRGEHGIMCVGSAYTLSNGVSLSGQPLDETRQGPFSEYRSEVGLQEEHWRMRIKLDYAIIEDDADSHVDNIPPLHLKSLTVCRETLNGWPDKEEVTDDALFGIPGAPGGLYDPPPVGTQEQAGQYMLMDLEGRATILFPYKIDQHPSAHEGQGWVTSLDWTPSNMRYQVDRKVKGGTDLLCLRTLELSEVQSVDADEYRPRDGGQNMRQ